MPVPETQATAEPRSWAETIKQYGPAVVPILVGAMLGAPRMRLAAMRYAPHWAETIERSRLPFVFREVPDLAARGMVEPTHLSNPELREFARHPASQRFAEGDPAMAVQVRTFPAVEARQRVPTGPTGKTPLAPIHGLLHEVEHAARVAQGAETTTPLTKGAYLRATAQEPLLQSPEFPDRLRDLLAKWPDLYGMYYNYRTSRTAPAIALGELLTEARARHILGEVVPPPMRLRPHQMMIFRTRPEIEAMEEDGREILAELDRLIGRTKRVPAIPERLSESRLRVDATLDERLDAMRRALAAPQRPVGRDEFARQLMPRTFSDFRNVLREMVNTLATKEQIKHVILNAESHGIAPDRLRRYVRPEQWPWA